MSRYRGPRLRIVRRLGKLPGFSNKVSKKLLTPGQHGVSSTKKLSQFSVRLKEKQKLRFHYGITERQLINYIKKAKKKKGSVGKLLLTLLEMRLDNIVFRSGFAPTVISARQLVSHGHILVNGRLVNIPSFSCRPRDSIKVNTSNVSQNCVKRNMESTDSLLVPQHIFLEKEKLESKILSSVNRKSISLVINELLVVEFYSRKL